MKSKKSPFCMPEINFLIDADMPRSSSDVVRKKNTVGLVLNYLKKPDSECDIETMVSALEVDTN